MSRSARLVLLPLSPSLPPLFLLSSSSLPSSLAACHALVRSASRPIVPGGLKAVRISLLGELEQMTALLRE